MAFPAFSQTSPATFSPLALHSGILSDAAVARLSAEAAAAAPDFDEGQAAPPGASSIDPAPVGPAQAPLAKPPSDTGYQYKPFTVGQKFKADTKDTFGPIALIGVGISAGIDQFTNTPSAWGQGAAGYGRRYASDFGINAAHQYFGFALQTALHEDPRYFPSADRSVKGRLKSVVRQAFITRTDSGGETFAYARWASAFGAGLLSDTWMPQSDAHIHDGLAEGAYLLGINVGLNLAEEFIPFFRHLQP